MLNSRSFDDLNGEFRVKAMAFISSLRSRGLDVVVASTLRDLESQASLFRMNRSKSEIEAKVAKMRGLGFDFLADVINRVGPQKDDGLGRKTNAGPGESWHNYGLAMDAYPIVHGKLASAEDPLWDVYGNAAAEHGLEWAGNWKSFKEMPHVQLAAGSNPLRVLLPTQVRSALSRWL